MVYLILCVFLLSVYVSFFRLNLKRHVRKRWKDEKRGRKSMKEREREKRERGQN